MIDGADLDLFERSLRTATARHTGDALDRALVEVGWHDALADDARAAVAILFALQGEANATSSALGHVLAGRAAVLPALGSVAPPGALDRGRGRVHVRGLATSSLAANGTARVVVTTREAGAGAIGLDVPVGALALRPIAGIDPDLGLVEVTGEVASSGDAAGAPVDWRAAVALGQLAVAHELVGASRTMLRLAREHALERVQFGRPIAGFQAVRHRLADTLVAVETAEAALDAAWLDRSPVTASMAKALAGRGARTAARHCQQVLAGIGFTTEHPLHRYVRRVLVLDELLGSARTLTRALGDDLLATRRLPPPLPL